MKLLLLGATGRVGQVLLSQALSQGHTVTALVRNPAKLTLQHANLKAVQGNLTDPKILAPLMSSHDAVLSTLGHNSLKKSNIQTAATRAVLACIAPSQRFISLTGTGIADPHDPPHTAGARLITALIKLAPGELYLDGLHHVQLLQASTAHWVVVRAPVMTSGPATKHYRTGYFRINFATTATRADVADFMLANLTTDEWLGQLPLVASSKS